MSNNIVQAFIWKLLERFGVSGIQFILQLLLARLLSPEDYGILAIMVIFISLATVFIQSGFNTALIQNKDVTDEDYSSVFWVSLSVATFFYLIIYCAAPYIAAFYNTTILILPLRILALILFPGTLNSIQLAKFSREMEFQKVFISSISSTIISGIAGVLIAYLGGGIWALVVQSILNTTISCIVILTISHWYPRFIFNFKRIAILFNYGWKILVSNLLDTLDEHLQNLIVGKKYNNDTLGYYHRGVQLPQFLIQAIVGALQSIMLPAMSAKQDHQNQVKDLAQSSIIISSYIIFPMMAGLASVAEPLVCILLTEKWLPCVPYIQINCFIFAFYSVHVCNLQSINAMGHSDLFLKLEVTKKAYELVFIAIAVFCFDSPLAIAMTGTLGTWIGWLINAHPNKKLIHYSFREQFHDLMPMMLMTLIMSICVLEIGYYCHIAAFSHLLTLLLQVMSGFLIYLILSIIIQPQPYKMLLKWLKRCR